jgi:hypothetical protein
VETKHTETFQWYEVLLHLDSRCNTLMMVVHNRGSVGLSALARRFVGSVAQGFRASVTQVPVS